MIEKAYRYNVNRDIDLLGIRLIVKRRDGYTLRYRVAFGQMAYSPTRMVAWRGKFTSPLEIEFQQSGETGTEFVDRVERTFLWK